MNKIQIRVALQEYKRKVCIDCKRREDCYWYEKEHEKDVSEKCSQGVSHWLNDLVTMTCTDPLRRHQEEE